jgi:serine protease Do
MFTKSKLFAAFLLSVSTGAATAAFSQTAPPAPAAQQRAESPQMQLFRTDNGASYLGVQSQEVTKENFAKFGLREVRGVAVERVMENSPAAQAGLQTGDVILRFEGEEVTSTRKLTRLIGEVAPDHRARITVLRNGSERELTATMGRRPGPAFQAATSMGDWYGLPGIPEFPRTPATPSMPFPRGTTVVPAPPRDYQEFFRSAERRQIGVGLATINKQLGDYFGVSDGKGVLVNNVRENSPAAKAGLRAGDVIVEVDGKVVDGPAALTRAISEKKEGDVNLTIIRNKNRQTVRVTPEKATGGGMFRMEEFDRDGGDGFDEPRRQFRMTLPTNPVMPARRLPSAAPRTL